MVSRLVLKANCYVLTSPDCFAATLSKLKIYLSLVSLFEEGNY